MSPRAHGRLNCQLRRQLAATACDCFSLTKCPGSARVSLDYGRTNLRQQQQPPPLSSSREHKTIEQAPLFNSLMRNCRQRILALARFSPIWSAAGISPASPPAVAASKVRNWNHNKTLSLPESSTRETTSVRQKFAGQLFKLERLDAGDQ